MAEEVRRVTEHLGILDATEEVYEQTTGKGFDFEDLVDECVSTLAAVARRPRRDHRHHQGHHRLAGGRRGDHAQPRRHVRVRRVLRHRGEEPQAQPALDAGRARRGDVQPRGARGAIAVFRSQEQAPTAVPFMYSDDKAIVVLDPDDCDDAALRLAYMWARWTVRKQLAAADEAEGVDVERVRCLLDDAATRARAPRHHQAGAHGGAQGHRPGRRAGRGARARVARGDRGAADRAAGLSGRRLPPAGAGGVNRRQDLRDCRSTVDDPAAIGERLSGCEFVPWFVCF